MGENYHHGNLRQALIEAGLKIINESGEDSLSLRKAAAACGVSHAAPYAHFKDKAELINAIKEMVTDKFTNELEKAIADVGSSGAEAAICEMGKKYILFFKSNPDYFYFLFHKQAVSVHLSMDKEYEEDYLPFLILRRLFKKCLKEKNIKISKEGQELKLLNLWATVQGYSSIACMKNVALDLDWKDIVDSIFLTDHSKEN